MAIRLNEYSSIKKWAVNRSPTFWNPARKGRFTLSRYWNTTKIPVFYGTLFFTGSRLRHKTA